MVANAVWPLLRGLTDRMIGEADDTTVALVANVKAAAVLGGVDDRATEHLSDDEAGQLLSGLRTAGFRVRFFDGEEAFIAAALADGLAGAPNPLVYNLAQSGRDPGRKSLVPAFCALAGLASCNSGAYAVSLARNKLHVHSILSRFGLPTPRTWCRSQGRRWLLDDEPPHGVTLIAKALHESASIGLDASSIGRLDARFVDLLDHRSSLLGQPMVAQEFIPGRELEVPVSQAAGRPHALGAAMVTLDGEPLSGSRILDYETVASDGFAYSAPRDGDRDACLRASRIAASVFDVLGLAGFARVDFRLSDDGRLHVIDVATSPHLVHHGSFSHVFAERGWRHEEMLACMVAVNAERCGRLTPPTIPGRPT